MSEATFGKYRLIAELGQGGMADVFLAVGDSPLGARFRKLSVVKRLRQNLAEDPEFIQMLVEEARISARLNHPNVVQTNEVGAIGERYFIAMEYLDGQPLHRIQQRLMQRKRAGGEPPLGMAEEMIVVVDALAGLHHAHTLADYDGTPLDIVHRDVTPQNIFVTYAGQVKVVDFGIAKAAGRAAETRQGIIKGKVRYMAPEHAAGKSVDRRADVFSMGVILWEIVAGRRMWLDMDDLGIVEVLLRGEVRTSPRDVNPATPPALDAICRRALAHRPEERYESAEAFRLELEQYLADSGQLVSARRGLVAGVGLLFTDKRAAIKSIIEKQLSVLEAQGSGQFAAVRIPADSSSSGPVSGHVSLGVLPPPPSRSSIGALPVEQIPSTPAVPRSARPVARQAPAQAPAHQPSILSTVALCVAVAVAVAAVIVAIRVQPPRVEPPLVQTAPRPASSEIVLRFGATPGDARISIDDGPPHPTPIEVRLPKDGRDHRVLVEADGYYPKSQTLRFATDFSGFIALEPIAPRTPPSELSGTVSPTGGATPVIRRGLSAGGTPLPATLGASPVRSINRATKEQRARLDDADPWPQQ